MEYKKIAFFVEGYTEQEFVRKLLIEIFGSKRIAIEISKIKGGKTIPICHTILESAITTDETLYYILIYDCSGDGSIKSYILEHRDNLIKAGYLKVIGLRDIYPDFAREDIFELKKGMYGNLPQKNLPIKFVISIMEIESWFLADENHYEKIDSVLSLDYLKQHFNFDPSTEDTQLIDEAANFLKKIYTNVGTTYVKEKASIDRTINALDFSNVYFVVGDRIDSLKKLIDEFEEVLL
jgi:hypothetical protein